MKNTIYIDIDTDRTPSVNIGKPSEIEKPTTPEEASAMIIVDISCLCEALCSLIHMTDQSGYAKKEDLVNASIKYLNDMLVEPTKEESK